VGQYRRYRTAPEAKSLQSDTGIFEIDGIGKAGASSSRVRFKEQIMVSRHNNAMPVRQLTEPVVEVLHFRDGTAMIHKVPGMNQNIPIGNPQVSMETVRIAKADDFEAPVSALFVRFRGQWMLG
jgi:hypothetical protein